MCVYIYIGGTHLKSQKVKMNEHSPRTHIVQPPLHPSSKGGRVILLMGWFRTPRRVLVLDLRRAVNNTGEGTPAMRWKINGG